jgi:hypothetical protein
LLFNDGKPVPALLLTTTLAELRNQFGAVSWETQTLRGSWQHGEVSFDDNLTRFFVDIPDTQENRQFFVNYKQALKRRFDQIEI